MIKSRIKIVILASIVAVAMSVLCAGVYVAKADAKANGVPTISDTVTKGVPGEMTVENEIKTALMPIGHVLYIYGGGWNEEKDPSRGGEPADTGANAETKTIGVAKAWDDFYKSQGADFSPWDNPEFDFYENPKCVHYGTDCAGFLGWVLQNIMGPDKVNGFDTNGLNNEGWVTYAQWFGFGLSHLNFGERIVNPNPEIEDNNIDPYATEDKADMVEVPNDSYSYVPGNIYTFGKSGEYHCWLCLGKCADDSVLLVHCSAPGVYIGGTSPDPDNIETQAVKIAKTYMERYYTDFYNKFGVVVKPGGQNAEGKATGYLKYSEFNWDSSKLTDSAGYRSKLPADLMSSIYAEKTANASFKITGPTPTIYFNDALVKADVSSNSQIVYNNGNDSNVDVSFAIPAGYKFDSIKINDVDYSSQLVASSNTAKFYIANVGNYKIECASSELNPPSETAQTSDITYVLVAIISLIVLASGCVVLRKE